MDGTRTETTAALTRLTESRARRRCRLWAPEVEVPGGGRVDFMGFQPYGERPDASSIERGKLVCYEVKSCMADFESGYGLNFVGDENWLVCPRELCDKLREAMRVPDAVGVLCPDAGWKRLLEVIHQPPDAYRYRRAMSAAEAIWRIAKESYAASFEPPDQTCHPLHTREKWQCDACGCEIRPGFMPEFHGTGSLCYCPNCGARVVSE